MSRPPSPSRTPLARLWHHNGLSVTLLAFFLVTYAVGQTLTGARVHNAERAEHGEAPLSLVAYLRSAHFAEATTENWESEFLQMFIYVFITAFMFQRGSAESNDPDAPPPRRRVRSDSPWPVRRGGWWLRWYSHSLSLALAFLFLLSFAMHAWASTCLENEERLREGKAAETVLAHLGGARLWFESFQNWQSEFLAIFTMVVLTIFLRERNSPESKAVEAPHHETG